MALLCARHERGEAGMVAVETIGRVRAAYLVKGKKIKTIARELRLSRNTVRRIVRSGETEHRYDRKEQPLPRLGSHVAELDALLEANAGKAKRERHEVILIDGVTTAAKIAHIRLCHSRMPFVRAYPREAQEMLFDAHDKAFAFFRGACQRGIYDNMKTAVDAILVGKERAFNRRFLQMTSHHLFEPTACTPGAGWEKGQVENQVGTVRERFFAPHLKFKSYEDLNAYLLDRWVAWAKGQPHVEQKDKTIFQVFEAERPALIPYRGPFDGFRATTVAVSKTCLVRFDGNKYSVMAKAVGRPVDVHAYADRIVIKQDGEFVASIVAVSAATRPSMIPGVALKARKPNARSRVGRKPGALRNGAPFKDWPLPGAIERVRRKLAGTNDGDKQMVKVLTAVLTDGLAAVEAACAEALEAGIGNADVILNALARRQQREPVPPVMTPKRLALRLARVVEKSTEADRIAVALSFAISNDGLVVWV